MGVYLGEYVISEVTIQRAGQQHVQRTVSNMHAVHARNSDHAVPSSHRSRKGGAARSAPSSRGGGQTGQVNNNKEVLNRKQRITQE